MNDLLSTIFPCFPLRERGIQLPTSDSPHHHQLSTSEKSSFLQASADPPHLTCEEAATRIVNVLFEANKDGVSVIARIDDIAIQAGGWSQWLADKIRQGMEAALRAGKEMSAAMAVAYDKACEAAKVFEHFTEDHPLATAVFVTLIAIGVLAIMAPYVIELLGFGELGPIEGRLAIQLSSRCTDWC